MSAESVADIIADMCETAIVYRRDTPSDSPLAGFAETLLRYAKDLKAASERDMNDAALIGKQGAWADALAWARRNNNALRAALAWYVRADEEAGIDKAACEEHIAKCDPSDTPRRFLQSLAALDCKESPPRNCDIYPTAPAALAAYTKNRDLALSPEAQDAIWWLFEKTETEATK